MRQQPKAAETQIACLLDALCIKIDVSLFSFRKYTLNIFALGNRNVLRQVSLRFICRVHNAELH